jgi:hypothetical protein
MTVCHRHGLLQALEASSFQGRLFFGLVIIPDARILRRIFADGGQALKVFQARPEALRLGS